jgi:FMN phosphatase YigB (HAD superfamily)
MGHAPPARGGVSIHYHAPMTIRAILFDLDDTLWRIGRTPDWDRVTVLQSDQIAGHCHELGLGRLDRVSFLAAFWAEFGARYAAPDPSLREIDGPGVLREVLSSYELDCAPGDAVLLWEALHEVPFQHFNISIFPDTAATVQFLHDAGYRLAIVTSRPLTSRMLMRHLADQGIPGVFDAVVTTGDVGFRKPHHAVFEAALARLDARPDQSVVVGDSYENDVVPAANLGATAVLKLNDHAPDPTLSRAHHQVPTLGSLLELDILKR